MAEHIQPEERLGATQYTLSLHTVTDSLLEVVPQPPGVDRETTLRALRMSMQTHSLFSLAFRGSLLPGELHIDELVATERWVTENPGGTFEEGLMSYRLRREQLYQGIKTKHWKATPPLDEVESVQQLKEIASGRIVPCREMIAGLFHPRWVTDEGIDREMAVRGSFLEALKSPHTIARAHEKNRPVLGIGLRWIIKRWPVRGIELVSGEVSRQMVIDINREELYHALQWLLELSELGITTDMLADCNTPENRNVDVYDWVDPLLLTLLKRLGDANVEDQFRLELAKRQVHAQRGVKTEETTALPTQSTSKFPNFRSIFRFIKNEKD